MKTILDDYLNKKELLIELFYETRFYKSLSITCKDIVDVSIKCLKDNDKAHVYIGNYKIANQVSDAYFNNCYHDICSTFSSLYLDFHNVSSIFKIEKNQFHEDLLFVNFDIKKIVIIDIFHDYK